MEIQTENVTLNVRDGTTMRAWVARPTAARAHPGLLVFHEAFGVNAHIRDVTERFAREGYLAIAPELFHRSGPGFEGRYDDFAGAIPHMKELNDTNMEVDERAAYDWLRANGAGNLPISSVGYCMGGRAAFLAALCLPLARAVSYYGGGIAPSATNRGLLHRVDELCAPVLLFWGGRDRHITTEMVRAITDALHAAGKNFVNVEISDADHGFFCDARGSFSSAAVAQAWPLTLAFLGAQEARARAD